MKLLCPPPHSAASDSTSQYSDVGCHYSDGRERLVTIHGWCLMGNHYHLLVSEKEEGGLGQFLKKLNMGYAKYFNERYDRTGALFQGKTKKVLIGRDAHFLWILLYIHFNPLDFLKGAVDWRTQCLVNSSKALEYLKDYRWASYHDYLGEGELSPILAGSFMYEDPEAHLKEARRYLNALANAPLPIASLE